MSVALPLPPKQTAFAAAVLVLNADGWLIVIDFEIEQPLPSVIVAV